MLRTMKIILTPQQKQQLEVMHDSTRDGRVRDRIKAVLLASEGWSQTMISQALRIHESTVARHLSDYVLSENLSLKMVVARADFLLSKPCSLSNIYLRRRTFIPIK